MLAIYTHRPDDPATTGNEMGAQTWEDVKRFFDTSAGAACIGGGATTLALIGAAMALWPESVALIVFG